MTGYAWLRVACGFALPSLASGCSDDLSVDGDEVLGTSSQEIKKNVNGVKTEEICFTVHNPNDPVAIPLTGTRFSKRSFNAQKSEDRVILLTGDSCGTGPAVGVASESVILGGHSIGGGEVMQYATRYHDIDGMISFGWTNTGAASIPTGFFLNWIVPQFQQGKDYVTFFRPGPSDVSSDCVLGLFSQPLAATDVDPAVVNLECANANLGTSPSGELAGTNALRQANLVALPGVGPTPALLTFADLDTMPELADAVVSWLDSRGLDPR